MYTHTRTQSQSDADSEGPSIYTFQNTRGGLIQLFKFSNAMSGGNANYYYIFGKFTSAVRSVA